MASETEPLVKKDSNVLYVNEASEKFGLAAVSLCFGAFYFTIMTIALYVDIKEGSSKLLFVERILIFGIEALLLVSLRNRKRHFTMQKTFLLFIFLFGALCIWSLTLLEVVHTSVILFLVDRLIKQTSLQVILCLGTILSLTVVFVLTCNNFSIGSRLIFK